MGFDRGWTYGQPSGDLRIVQSLDHQGQNFTLALRQVKAGRWRLIGCLDQGLSGLRRECGAAGVRSADGLHQFIGRDILEQIADRSGFQRVLDQVSLFERWSAQSPAPVETAGGWRGLRLPRPYLA